jgi:hypothetical protein
MEFKTTNQLLMSKNNYGNDLFKVTPWDDHDITALA